MARERHRLEHHAIVDDLEVAVVVSPMGFRCGYVRVPHSHPWFGLEQPDSVHGRRCAIEVSRGMVMPVYGHDRFPRDDQLSYRLDAHGGITMTGKLGVEGLEDWWCIGFDCAHLYDGKDEALMSPHHLKLHREYGLPSDGYETVRSREYVLDQCEQLALQIARAGRDAGPLEWLRWIPRAIRGPRIRTLRRPRLVLWGARRLEAQYGGLDDFCKLTVFKDGVIG